MSSGFFMNESFWRSSDFQKMNDCLIFSLFDGKSFLNPPMSVTLLGAEVSRNIFFSLWPCQRTLLAILEKICLSLSLLCLSKWSLKIKNGHPVQLFAPPVLQKAGALGLIGLIFLRLSQLVYVLDNIFVRKRCLSLRSRPFIIENCHAERSHRVKI